VGAPPAPRFARRKAAEAALVRRTAHGGAPHAHTGRINFPRRRA